MIPVCCPHCFTRALAPAQRFGRGGARIRCPGCERGYHWPALHTARGAGPDPAAPWDSPGAARAPQNAVEEMDARGASPATLARVAIEELAAEHADELVAAWSEGVLFERCGDVLLAAWEHYRRSAGEAADPALFRAVLRARLGIDLPDGAETPA